ncbi:MAG: HNH endonuclease [Candidatus Heimdallarchaeota archaeon]
METKITKNYNQGGYEQIVKYLVESKTIYFIDCTCGNFSGVYTPKKIVKGKTVCAAKWYPGERLKNSGSFSDKIYYAEPCKHLQPIVKVYEMQGLTLKRPKPMTGTAKCTAELKRFLFERSGGLCECGCGRNGQEVHRKIAKTNGGKYNKDNCVLLSGECHQRITYQKWQSSPGKKLGGMKNDK